MQVIKLPCPECQKEDEYALNRWGGCKYCGLLIYVKKLTTQLIALKTGTIDHDIFKPEDSGKVLFIRPDGKLIDVDLDHQKDILNLTNNLPTFDRNLLEWQNKVKDKPERGSQFSLSRIPDSRLDSEFWQTGHRIALDYDSLIKASDKWYRRKFKGGYSKKEIQVFTEPKLNSEFWEIGSIRSRTGPDNKLEAPPYYKSIEHKPSQDTGIVGFLTYVIGFFVFLAIIIAIIVFIASK